MSNKQDRDSEAPRRPSHFLESDILKLIEDGVKVMEPLKDLDDHIGAQARMCIAVNGAVITAIAAEANRHTAHDDLCHAVATICTSAIMNVAGLNHKKANPEIVDFTCQIIGEQLKAALGGEDGIGSKAVIQAVEGGNA